MPGCKLKTCIRKQNQNVDEPESGQSQRTAAPVPRASFLNEDIPGTSSGVRPAVRAGREPEPPHDDLYHSMKLGFLSAWKSASNLWKKTKDPYSWQLLKSITMFTLGLKLFDDIHRHLTKDSTSCV
ncbi:uncharacterized protein LOC123874848 isoform X1 [Maniola jurtina]|uniref:uncharacterized protein LOC123874848 isoform X1 n=1 Tax=Maniola jurtina TaxID=191418 RepID=UPI001E68FA58|nr:uncharacterized protein LOC123874848 isoform X1 [Maniola jurtina]XP_045776329.1 uncharacterized protein LOC123874848 isoform X1 [Maniola jurtina]XP_045776330.1 uncharacterized protein LOC123874848 isoform X1 [Maniola jurtina]XP_045776331.1 uncharacterized protein LOC123874848 isoform X1 [Maniola jurtina]